MEVDQPQVASAKIERQPRTLTTARAMDRRWLRPLTFCVALLLATTAADDAPRVVVKLGGSAVTRKHKFESLNSNALRTTARQISEASGDGGGGVLLVHGCGSFGHFQAHEFGIAKGIDAPEFSWLGFAQTRKSATKLNGLILEALLAVDLPAVHYSPFPLWRKRGGAAPTAATAKAGVEQVRELLRAGLMPVMHGDSVIDEENGCGILSGDALLEELCSTLKPKLAVFLTDVAGVYDRPPSEAGARLIPEIRVGPSGELILPDDGGEESADSGAGIASSTTHEHDVTGGLAAKLQSAAAIAAGGVPVVIVQVATPHAAEALAGRWPEVCTRIVPEVAPEAVDEAAPRPLGRRQKMARAVARSLGLCSVLYVLAGIRLYE